MIEALYVVEMTITTPAKVPDRYGNARDSYGADASSETVKGWFSQTVSEQAAAIVTDAVAFVPPETTVGTDSRVTVDGDVWVVVGVPKRPRTKTGAVHHIEIELKAVTSS